MSVLNGAAAAVVFDCDGTLVDTEPISDEVWFEVLGDFGYQTGRADLDAVLGRPWHEVYGYFADRVDLPPSDELRQLVGASFVRLFDERVTLFDDTVEVARTLQADGVPLAVCTSSSQRHLDRVLDLGLRDLFTVTVAADDTDDHKPEPAPYLLAAERLGVEPADCTAVEDSPVGVAAAVAAGMRTIAVVRHAADPAALSRAHVVVDRLTLGVLANGSTRAAGPQDA